MPLSDFEDELSPDELFPIDFPPVEYSPEHSPVPMSSSSQSIINRLSSQLPPRVESPAILPEEQVKLHGIIAGLSKFSVTLQQSLHEKLASPPKTSSHELEINRLQIQLGLLSAQLDRSRDIVTALSAENLRLKQALAEQRMSSASSIDQEESESVHAPKRQRR